MSSWPWDRLAQTNAPSHAVLVEALQPRPGERWLDVGTGSGGVAHRAARAGAVVTGVDIAPEAIEEARKGGEAEFLVADAQVLPFPDASFDVVASAFGVNFAPDHSAAARELARVCRPGGRLGLTLMPKNSRAGEMWTLIRRFDGANGDHPADWSEWDRRESPPEADAPAPEAAWEFFQESFGPLRDLVSRLSDDAVAELRAEFIAIRERFANVSPSYFLVLGRRR